MLLEGAIPVTIGEGIEIELEVPVIVGKEGTMGTALTELLVVKTGGEVKSKVAVGEE